MAELIAFRLDNEAFSQGDEVVLVEVDALEPGIGRAGRPGEVAAKANKSLAAALDMIRPTANALVATISAISTRPDEVTAEFGVKLTAKAGAIIAESQSEGHITVTLTWRAFSPPSSI
jgi:hypothetical protein